MTDHRVLDALQELTDQMGALQQRQAAQDAALLVLARHLAVRGGADLQALALDLQAMAGAVPGVGQQSALTRLAGAARLAHSQL